MHTLFAAFPLQRHGFVGSVLFVALVVLFPRLIESLARLATGPSAFLTIATMVCQFLAILIAFRHLARVATQALHSRASMGAACKGSGCLIVRRDATLHSCLHQLPQLIELLSAQLEETNRVTENSAIAVMEQFASLEKMAATFLTDLEAGKIKAAGLYRQAQDLIDASRLELTEMRDYKILRESQLHQDEEAIRFVVALMKDVDPLVGQIGKLSKETRLLAFNAAIQAATDSGVGRSFIVVADQMRTLAKQSDDASSRVGTEMLQVSRTVTEKLAAMIAPDRIEAERKWLDTLSISTTQMPEIFLAAVTELERSAKDSVNVVQTIFSAVTQAGQFAQFQDISRQQIQVVQSGLESSFQVAIRTLGRIEEVADLDANFPTFGTIVADLESKYTMRTQRAIHDRIVRGKIDDTQDERPVIELF